VHIRYPRTHKRPSLKASHVEVITQPQNQKTQSNGNQEHRWYDYFLDHLTDWLLAIFSGLLVLFTYRLWKATVGLWEVSQRQSRDMKASIAVAQEAAEAAKKSAKVADESLTSTQRAFVFLKDIKFKEIRGRGYSPISNYIQTTWQLFPIWTNSGDTPTRNLIISVNCQVFDVPLPEDFNFPYINADRSDFLSFTYFATPQNVPMMIGPKAEIGTEPLVIADDHNSISYIEKSHYFIYMWGEAKYYDIFEGTPEHIARFCVELIFTEQMVGIIREPPLMSFHYYKKYNYAD
jgi:hypothetical protein